MRDDTAKELSAQLEAARGGDRAAAAHLLSCLGRSGEKRASLLRALQPWTTQAHSFAFLGSAGAGKSTLMVEVAKLLADGARRIGFVAGGAATAVRLGEQPRHESLLSLPSVYLHVVGISGRASLEAALAADLFAHIGCDPILLELGSGRRGFPHLAWGHSLIVVLSPGGPEASALAASGILRAADVVVLNKADREGADRAYEALATELRQLAHPARLLRTVAYRGEGIAELAAALLALGDRLRSSAEHEARDQAAVRLRVQELVADELHEKLETDAALGRELERAASELRRGRIDLVTAAEQTLARMLRDA